MGRQRDIIFFGNSHQPDTLAAFCCAQCAMSRDQTRKRPHKQYVPFRNWLLKTAYL